MPNKFTSDTLYEICDELAMAEPIFYKVIALYSYPPFWARPNNFESLVQIILEQQVSLASANAAYQKLLQLTKSCITPEVILRCSDEELRAAYVSRQKISYIRGIAMAIQSGRLDLNKIALESDDNVRKILITEKGIGNWTIDVYMIEVLHRADIFPPGDIAAIRALAELKTPGQRLTGEQCLAIAEAWRPHRTIATMLLWHHYLSSRGRSEEMLAGS